MQRLFTPQNITKIKENEIFVFGSNLNGNHAGGTAKLALEKFGAQTGQSEGLFGQSYAIPTLDKDMQKQPLEEISESIDRLYQFADENADLNFWVTKIGCGIAGFKEKEIADLFKLKETPFNVYLPMEFSIIKGVKAFDKGLSCHGFQYDENKDFVHNGNVKTGISGFHFCENPLGVFAYYKPTMSEFAEVEGSEKIHTQKQDGKVSVSNLKIKGKIDIAGVLKLGLDYTSKKVDFFRKRAEALIRKNTSNSSVNSGLYSSVNSGSNYSVNSGLYYSVNSGLYSSVNSGRDSSVNSGLDYSVCAGRFFSEIKLEGNNSFGIAGKGSKIKGKLGCAICIVEYDNNNNIIAVNSAIIDGKTLKEDVYYKLENGKFVETE